MRTLPTSPMCLLALLLLAGPACDRGANTPAARTPAQEVALPEPLTRALGGERLTPTDAPTGPLAWSVPAQCQLAYGLTSTFSMTAHLEGREPDPNAHQAMEVNGGFQLQPGKEADLEVTYGDITIAHRAGATRNPGATQPGGTLAATWLKREGGTLAEVDGPTGAWSAYGSYPGAVIFFPTLPDKIGVEVPWPLTIHARGSGAAVEARRGTIKLPPGAKAPSPTTIPTTATSRLAGWFRFKGEPVALIEATWTQTSNQTTEQPMMGESTAMKMATEASATWQGRYLVLASGRLLAGHVTGTNELTMTTTFPGRPPKVMRQTHALEAQARLLRACAVDEPTLDDFDKTRTAAERALDLWVEHRKALAEGRFEDAAALYDPALVQAHGPALAATLKAHTERYTERSLGAPEMARDIKAEGDLQRMTLIGGAANYDTPGTGGNMTIHTIVRVRVQGDQARIVSVGADTTARDQGWEFLEISSSRLMTAATAGATP